MRISMGSAIAAAMLANSSFVSAVRSDNSVSISLPDEIASPIVIPNECAPKEKKRYQYRDTQSPHKYAKSRAKRIQERKTKKQQRKR